MNMTLSYQQNKIFSRNNAMTQTVNENQLQDTANKLSLDSPIEGFLCVPARYEDYRKPLTQLDHSLVGENVTLRLRVSEKSEAICGYANRHKKVPSHLIRNKLTMQLHDPFSWAAFRLEVEAHTAHGDMVRVTIFGAIKDWEHIEQGQELILNGKLDLFRGQWQLSSPRELHEDQVGRIVPVYLGIAGQVHTKHVTQLIDWLLSTDELMEQGLFAAYQKIIDSCAGLHDGDILDYCIKDEAYIEHQTIFSVLASMHAPQDMLEAEQALAIVKRICILSMQCQAKLANTRDEHEHAPIGLGSPMAQWTNELVDVVEQSKGFPLTENQKQVANDIVARIQEEKPMIGLLSGEVGAGKTIAYAIPAVAAHRAGARVAIIAPTLLLANQIAREIALEFGEFASVERVFAGRKIRNIDSILVGTSGLNSVARKQDYVPDLLIFDEQHKLNTLSREEMVSPYTHTLEVSATPIPRSLALSFYDGVDLFTLNEQPVLKNVETSLVDTNQRGLATQAIREAVQNKKRVALVFTLVEGAKNEITIGVDGATRTTKKQKESEEVARRAATDSFDLFDKHFPEQVVLLHGQMSDAEKEAALDTFRSGEKPILITTTIFETGIDVPDISTLVIRDPENLGLSQLHQLRGRLARRGGNGHCFLLCDDLTALAENTYERLEFFTRNTDGYDLALHDMKSSGAGDLTGYQQRGKSTTVFKGIKLQVEDFLESEQIGLDIDAVEQDLKESSRQKNEYRQATLSA